MSVFGILNPVKNSNAIWGFLLDISLEGPAVKFSSNPVIQLELDTG
jgi:hypothetical protein